MRIVFTMALAVSAAMSITPAWALEASRSTDLVAPAALGPVLDRRLTELGEAVKPLAVADWQQRLKARGGRGSLAPLAPLDPSRELLIIFPGKGMNPQDLHALVELEDAFQVLICISDQKRSLADNARTLADALESVVGHRNALRVRAGLEADRDVRVIGHSFGAASSVATIGELARRGKLDGGPGSLFAHVLLIAIDGPWRGLDMPWVFTVPGVRQVAGWILKHVPVIHRRADPGSLAFVNGTHQMKTLIGMPLPPCVTLRLVTVLQDHGPAMVMGYVEPVEGWNIQELGRGELERLWRFYREGALDPGHLAAWTTPVITRSVALENLVRMLTRSANYMDHAADLVEAARASATAEEFGSRWNELVASIVATFHGQHTQFMWTDPMFMPWIRRTLSR